MALFFDKDWFDAALARAGLTRAILAQALGLGEAELAEVWKDQRELSARDVATLAALLAVPAEEIAAPCGRLHPRAAAASARPRPRSARGWSGSKRKLDELKALLLAREPGR